MVECQIEVENIGQLREKLKILNRENKYLKQQLSEKRGTVERHAKKLKSAAEDKRVVQKLLHSYLGAEVTKKDNAIEVYFKPFCSGTPQGHYVMVLQAQTETSWQVVGYNLPLSITKRQGTKVQSVEQLGKFIREIGQEVQAFAERKYQSVKTEEILKKMDASVWYTTKIQTIFLSLPMIIDGAEEKCVCEIELNYEVSHILPFRVTTNVQGLGAVKLERLRKRLDRLFKHFSLLTVMKEEFGNESTEGSVLSSILAQLSP